MPDHERAVVARPWDLGQVRFSRSQASSVAPNISLSIVLDENGINNDSMY